MIDRNHSSDSHDRGMARPREALGGMAGRLDWRAKTFEICILEHPNVTVSNSSRSGYNGQYFCEDHYSERN